MIKLNKEQQRYILEMLQEGFETGHPIYDKDEVEFILKEDTNLFESELKIAIDWYFELLELGPNGFYEEYPNLNWDFDFIEEFGYQRKKK